MGGLVLIAERISKSFGDRRVLADVSMALRRGWITSLLGPNGSGKTTLIKILAGIYKPTAGSVRHEGDKIRIAYLPQGRGLYESLTGWDNIMFYARLYGMDEGEARRRALEVLERLDLLAHANRRVASYSGGMKRKLSLLLALLSPADVLILDEPTAELDPHARRAVWEVLLEERRKGVAVLVATHHLEEAEALSDYVYLLSEGKIVAEGSPEELKRTHVPYSIIEIELFDERMLTEAAKIVGAEAKDSVLKIYSKAPDLDVPALVSRLYASGIEARSIRVSKPTLDDVFFKLTGRRIEDAEAG